MDMRHQPRCGPLLKHSNLHSMASPPTAMHLNNPLTFLSLLISLHSFDIREAIRKCNQHYNIRECKALAKAIRHLGEVSTQTKVPSISCKQQRPALSQALRVGRHNNSNRGLEDNGAGQDNPNDDVEEQNSMITSYEVDGV